LNGRLNHIYTKGFDVETHPEKIEEPMHWRKPQRVFVASMGDLFHDDVEDEFLWDVFDVMRVCPQHTFLVLTKRPERMRQFMIDCPGLRSPNMWLGVSVENQAMADERIPILLETPATVRWVSAEPLLEPIDLERYMYFSAGQTSGPWTDWTGKVVWRGGGAGGQTMSSQPSRYINWVVAGGESGPNHRPDDIAWYRDLRDQCKYAEVPYFFKQRSAPRPGTDPTIDGVVCQEFPGYRA
jgi:protein gp37